MLLDAVFALPRQLRGRQTVIERNDRFPYNAPPRRS
jgi:hypothetical protein